MEYSCQINYFDSAPSEIAKDLRALADLMSAEIGLRVGVKTIEAPTGAKPDPIIVGLAIAGLSLNAISAILAIMNAWRIRNRYTLSVCVGDTQVSIGGLSKKLLEQKLCELNKSEVIIDMKKIGDG